MTSSDLAAQIARELLGPVSGQEQRLPPRVQIPPPPIVEPEEPVAAVPEEKLDTAPPDQASQSSVPNAQSDPPVTVHRRLLSRLVRALPIASESQLQAMLNVFDHRAHPPAAQNPPPAPPSNIPQAAASNQSRWLALPPAPQSHHPGGISHGRVPTNDPLQHLLPQPSHKRSGLHSPPPFTILCPSVPVFLVLCQFMCRLCLGLSHNDGPLPRRLPEPDHRIQVHSSLPSQLRCLLQVHIRFVKSEYKLVRTSQAANHQLQSPLLNCGMT